jgi:hypothetical protein
LIRDGVPGHSPEHGTPVGDLGVLLRIGNTATRAKDDDLRDVAVVHPAQFLSDAQVASLPSVLTAVVDSVCEQQR